MKSKPHFGKIDAVLALVDDSHLCTRDRRHALHILQAYSEAGVGNINSIEKRLEIESEDAPSDSLIGFLAETFTQKPFNWKRVYSRKRKFDYIIFFCY